jgi:predicted nucleotidyltransferase
MKKSVEELQNAFQSIIRTLKRNKKVLAVFTFGSIVSGDVWEESDIDLFVVYNNEFDEIRDVYSKASEVTVHTKLLSKEVFLKLNNNDGKKGFVRNLLLKSKIVFSTDKEIEEAYIKARYSNDIHVERWNLTYLGLLLKDMKVCKKYYKNGGYNTCYEVLIRVLDNLSKLYLNTNGYAVTKDSVAMACNLNTQINSIIEKLFNSKVEAEIIKQTILFIEDFINENIVLSSKLLLECLSQKKEYVSSFEMINQDIFKEFNINLEDILDELSKRGLVQKDKRVLKDREGIKILNENVYYSNSDKTKLF